MKPRLPQLAFLALAGVLALAAQARAQRRPYVGYAYPAGAQQGTTPQIRLGGQDLDGIDAVLVTGAGVTGRVVDYQRRLNNQEVQLLREQLTALKRGGNDPAKVEFAPLIATLEQRTRDFVQTPACASISSLVIVEMIISPDAAPGPRELRLVTTRGVSNPLVFQVGQLRE